MRRALLAELGRQRQVDKQQRKVAIEARIASPEWQAIRMLRPKGRPRKEGA